MIVERDNDQDFTRSPARVRDDDHTEERAFDFDHARSHNPERDLDPDQGLNEARRDPAPDHDCPRSPDPDPGPAADPRSTIRLSFLTLRSTETTPRTSYAVQIARVMTTSRKIGRSTSPTHAATIPNVTSIRTGSTSPGVTLHRTTHEHGVRTSTQAPLRTQGAPYESPFKNATRTPNGIVLPHELPTQFAALSPIPP